MPVIAGPKIQMPPAQSRIMDQAGNVRPEWASFFHSLQQTTFNLTRHGPTSSRPTSAMDGRYIGMDYFDDSLGLKVTLKSVNPDVWVNGAGAVV